MSGNREDTVKLLNWLLYPVAWLFAKLFYKGDG